ncbi:unnamed protein product [Rhodiola kirilowii]
MSPEQAILTPEASAEQLTAVEDEMKKILIELMVFFLFIFVYCDLHSYRVDKSSQVERVSPSGLVE